jgi:hypothetical protein
MKNRYWLLYFSILAAILAGCLEMPQPVSATPTDTPLPVSTSTRQPVSTKTPIARAATVTAWALLIHAEPNVESTVTGWLLQGDVVTVLECTDKFCKLEQPFGYVWRGCLSDNPGGLGCTEK